MSAPKPERREDLVSVAAVADLIHAHVKPGHIVFFHGHFKVAADGSLNGAASAVRVTA